MHISTRPTYDYVYDRSLNLVANRASIVNGVWIAVSLSRNEIDVDSRETVITFTGTSVNKNTVLHFLVAPLACCKARLNQSVYLSNDQFQHALLSQFFTSTKEHTGE